MAKTKENILFAVGRRKTAVASLFLTKAKGKFLVNTMPINEYFGAEKDRAKWIKPFFVVGLSNPELTYSATIKVAGSGKACQAEAVTLAIAKALLLDLPTARPALRKQGLLTRDSRMVERKKPYLRKARKAPQYSKR